MALAKKLIVALFAASLLGLGGCATAEKGWDKTKAGFNSVKSGISKTFSGSGSTSGIKTPWSEAKKGIVWPWDALRDTKSQDAYRRGLTPAEAAAEMGR
ncbi:MAG: hypothetical protein KC877_04340 [Candidatus Kaiserbacteria bacterium]|nr:hypothetical protein [Candidatus Kaiserbacteria bacterium]MCB9816717.1 hypothetical protein [Candidatus Nomurabacteria bacterium]